MKINKSNNDLIDLFHYLNTEEDDLSERSLIIVMK